MIGESMNVYSKSFFFIFLYNCGLCFGAMESEPGQDTRSKKLRRRVSEIAVPRAQQASIHVSPMSSEYRRGMDLIHSLMHEDETESAICERLSTLPLTEQCEIIATAEQVGFDRILGIACNTCAQTLCSDKNLRILFEDQVTTHRLLSMKPRVTSLMRPLLQARIEKLFSHISSASYRDTMRLYYPTIEGNERVDVFMMPTNTLNDIVYIIRDYKGTFLGRRALGPIVPLIMSSDAMRNITIIDQEKIAHAVGQLSDSQASRSFCAFFNGLTYKSNHDGSLIVALAGSERHESDVLVIIRRIQGNSILATKVLQLASPVLTFPCTLCKKKLRDIPLINMSYDMNASFMIRPYSHIIAYIDVNHNIHILDLDSTRSSQVTTQGNISSMAWSPDGTRLAYASRDGKLYLNDCSAMNNKCFEYDNEIRKIQWSIDGTRILLMLDTKVKLVNSVDGSEVSTYKLQDKLVQAVLSDDLSKILVSCANQTIYLIDVNTATCNHVCKIDSANITSLMLSPDNLYAIISCVQGEALRAYVWNTENQSLEFYHDINGANYNVLATKMQHGRLDFQSLTMAQLILLMAAEQITDQKKFAVTESHLLYPHIACCVPVLRKYITSKLLVP